MQLKSFVIIRIKVLACLEDHEEYESWIMQDQVVFICLFATISESVLPRVMSCKHAFEVCDKIHRHLDDHMKARVRQLYVELKLMKKCNIYTIEYVLQNKSIVNSLIVVGDSISEQD